MQDSDDMVVRLWVWVLLIVIVALSMRSRKMVSVGLPLMYLYDLSINHWFGAVIHTLPWHDVSNHEIVEKGFRQAFYGVVAFAVGNVIVAPILMNIGHFKFLKPKGYAPDMRLPLAYLITGLSFYFLLSPVIGGIPSVRTFVYSGWSLLILGFCLISWKAWKYRRHKGFLRWVLAALVFPVFTTMNQGFLGFGISALLIVLVFVSTFYKPKWRIVLGGFMSIYLGLSLFVTYLRDRNELRQVVWYERESINARMNQFLSIFTSFEFLDLNNPNHLERIDSRLNQNFLVGRSVEYLENGNVPYSHGGTLRDALISFVPRIVWTNKPIVAGGMDIVNTYTGILFPEGTAVGAGQVMEFYINYGTPCVFLGFLVLGIIITFFDVAAGNNLAQGNWHGFVYWFLPGIGFLHAGGSLVEVVSTAAASIVFCVLVNRFILSGYIGNRLSRLRWKRYER